MKNRKKAYFFWKYPLQKTVVCIEGRHCSCFISVPHTGVFRDGTPKPADCAFPLVDYPTEIQSLGKLSSEPQCLSILLLILRRVEFRLSFFNPLSYGCCPANKTQFFCITKSNRCFISPELSSEFNITDHAHLHCLLLVLTTVHFPRGFLLSVSFLLLFFSIWILDIFRFHIYFKEFNEHVCLHCPIL